MSKAGQQILYMESGGEKYVKLGDYLKLLREISNLAEAGSELAEGNDLAAKSLAISNEASDDIIPRSVQCVTCGQDISQEQGNDLLATDTKQSVGISEAQMRDFLLTTYTEYEKQVYDEYVARKREVPTVTIGGYIEHLRNSK